MRINISTMRNFYLLLAFLTLLSFSTLAAEASEEARWQQHAQHVRITRDDWGIAHVVGKTDADAVFGAVYAQAEDDFNRMETNYINAMGRLAEAEGEGAIWKDLRMKMFIDPEDLKKYYAQSPAYLQNLMTAWADGLNFYLAKHPEVRPRVIRHFEPWMALSFTEGSIGGDIESINLDRLRAMYDTGAITPSAQSVLTPVEDKEPSGSNGIAIAPKNTKNGNALFLINPHTSFFFRSELQMTSGEGLNVYGASTWGQFFIYQGFNEHCGWMHTSSAVDAIDEFRETVVKQGSGYRYKFGSELRPIAESVITIPYKTAAGMSERRFTVYRTHHGPVIRKDENGNWITISLMNTPVPALMQSWGRTKAKNIAEYEKVMELHGNSSNNTIYADDKGHIAYFHANYVPVRNGKFDWTAPVDGSDPATEYRGLLSFKDSPNLIDPASGWVYNSNNWPWSAGGASSLRRSDYPRWVDNGVESSRGLHAIRVLENKHDFTLDSLRGAAYDSYLTWFDVRLPALIKAWDSLPASDPMKTKTAEQISVLRKWDQRWSVDSVATSLAIFWGNEIVREQRWEFNVPVERQTPAFHVNPRYEWFPTEGMDTTRNAHSLLEALVKASEKLAADFGSWKTPWGDINRFQRLTGDIDHPFTDAGPSIPVGFTSSVWGSLASFGAGPKKGTKKWYGTSGNSFVAVVEFGKKVRARSVTAGGESGHPGNKHFNDQAERYAEGALKEVYFYPEQLKGHTEAAYHPGQ